MTVFVTPALANTDDPLTVVNNLTTFIFGIIRAVGIIMMAYGVVQIGLSFKTQDSTQKAIGVMVLVGGIIITFTREILTLITGSPV